MKRSVRIHAIRCQDVDASTRAGIVQVFGRAFDAPSPNEPIAAYLSSIDQVLVARNGDAVVGFQFFQRRQVDGIDVHHFSLAGRLPGARYRGMQAAFGRAVVHRAIWTTVPWRATWVAGVTNSVRSYANLRAVGGRCFPDVERPAANPFGERYRAAAEVLGIRPVDPRGVVPDRMAALGFARRPDDQAHVLDAAYDAWVGDRDNGLFVVAEIVPVRDVPRYVARRGRSRSGAIGNRSNVGAAVAEGGAPA